MAASATSADKRAAEIRQEGADRVAANRADHAKRVAKRKAEEKAHNEEQQARRDVVALERITADLRRAYFLQPGATKGGFEKALPKLLEEHRQANITEAVAKARGFSSNQVRRMI